MNESSRIGNYASIVCSHFNVSVKQIKSRDRVYVEARKWLYYLCRINDIEEQVIADYVGRDRSTINDVFSRMNKRVDRFQSLTKIKNKLLSEAACN